MNKYLSFISITFILVGTLAQNLVSQTENIGIGTTTPDNSAVLHITFSNPANPKGLLIPKLTTTERNLINSPANGLIIYNLTTNNIEYNSGTSGTPAWLTLFSSGNLTLANGNIFVGNGSNQAVAVLPSGDVTITNAGVTTIGTGAVTSTKIADGTIAAVDIASDAVTTAKIADENVTLAKLATSSVNSDKIVDGTIANADISATAEIAVTKLANSVTTGQLLRTSGTEVEWFTPTYLETAAALGGDLSGTIDNAQIVANAVTSAEIANNAVGETEISDNAVTNAKLADNAVGNAEMADNAINTAEIVNGAVTTVKIADGAVTGAKLAAGVVDATKLTLTNGRILLGTAGDVASEVVISGDAQVNSTGVLTINTSAVGSDEITNGSILEIDITDNAITANKLANNSVTTDKIGDNQVTSAKLAGSIAANKLTLTDGQIFVGNASNQAASVALSGDASILNTGALTVNRINGTSVANTTPTANQVLAYNSTNTRWEPKTLGIERKSRVRAFLNTTQTISNGVVTKVAFDTQTYEGNDDFSTTNNNFVAPVDGYYLVNSRVRFNIGNLTVIDKFAQVMIFVNGAVYSYGNRLTIRDADRPQLDTEGFLVSDVVFASAGQTIDIRVEHNYNGATPTITLSAGTTETYVSIHLLSE